MLWYSLLLMMICENVGRNGHSQCKITIPLLKKRLKQAQSFIWTIWTNFLNLKILCKTRSKFAQWFCGRIWKMWTFNDEDDRQGANFRRAHPNLRVNSSVWNIINMSICLSIFVPLNFFTNMETSPLLVNGCKFWLVPCSVNVNFSIWVKNSRKGPINNGQTHENTALFSWPWSNKDALVCHTYCETVVFPM